MRSTRIGICAVLAGDSYRGSICYSSHEIRNIGYFFDSETNDVDILLCVLPGLELLSSVEEIKKFATVNFIEREVNF
jgi:hypothetical protein